MSDVGGLIAAVVNWRMLLLVVVVFGVSPGLCIRLIVLMYQKGDPRRKKAIDEVYATPFQRRPIAVGEHFERALTTGLLPRLIAWVRSPQSKWVLLGALIGTVLPPPIIVMLHLSCVQTSAITILVGIVIGYFVLHRPYVKQLRCAGN